MGKTYIAIAHSRGVAYSDDGDTWTERGGTGYMASVTVTLPDSEYSDSFGTLIEYGPVGVDRPSHSSALSEDGNEAFLGLIRLRYSNGSLLRPDYTTTR